MNYQDNLNLLKNIQRKASLESNTDIYSHKNDENKSNSNTLN